MVGPALGDPRRRLRRRRRRGRRHAVGNQAGPRLAQEAAVLKYILDTNVVAALMKGDPTVVSRLRATAKTDVALPQPVAAEVAFGLARLPRSKRRDHLERAWHALAAEIPRLSWTDDVSEAFGRIKATLERSGRPIDDFDIAIAAHAVT